MKKKDNLDEFKLFIKVLTSYHYGCIKHDLPINMIMPLLGKIDFLILEKLNYNETNIETRLIQLCERIKEVSKGPSQLDLFLMYSIIITIEETHNFFIMNNEAIIKASAQSAIDPEEENGDEYWLTTWAPSKVAANPVIFLEKVEQSKDIFLEETKNLKYVLYNMIYPLPWGIPKTWSILRGEDSL